MAKRKARKAPLTAKRKTWVEQRAANKKVILKGGQLSYSIPIQAKYEKELLVMINSMADVTKRELTAVFKSQQAKEFYAEDASLSSLAGKVLDSLRSRFDLYFEKNSQEVTNRMISRIDKHSASSLKSSIEKISGGLSVKTDFISGDVGDTLRASVKRNVNLIKSIESQYFDSIEDLVMRSISPGGNGLQDLAILDKIKDKTLARGVSIAKDQTRKAYNNLNAARMTKAGLNEFIWRHSGGGRFPRDLHQNVLNGQTYSLDDLPVIDEKTGERGIPGQAINCRCTMEPIATFG